MSLGAPFTQTTFFASTPRAFALGQSGATGTPLDVFAGYGSFGAGTVQVRNSDTPGDWRMIAGVGLSVQGLSAGAPFAQWHNSVPPSCGPRPAAVRSPPRGLPWHDPDRSGWSLA